MAKAFSLPPELPFPAPRYNIAPTQPVAAVRQSGDGKHEFVSMRWGLVPPWCADLTAAQGLINARCETAATKPSFRHAFRSRRCLIPADGFYEWQKTAEGKQPFLISFDDGRPFAFAGLWERWQRGEQSIESCAILTTTANDLMRPIHERMPVILEPEAYSRWLDSSCQDCGTLQGLLTPYSGSGLVAFPVSRVVNNPRNETPGCVERVAAV